MVDADLIVVMDRGRIVERGRFNDLMAADELFHDLAVGGGLTAA